MKKNSLYLLTLIIFAFIVINHYFELPRSSKDAQNVQNVKANITLVFPVDRYPETGRHIKDAINAGEPAVCTIDRKDAGEHRKESLKGIPTKKGYDRDEWPMAMCAEGGTGANIEYISPADNRGAGSWVSNQLDAYPDGTKVLVVVK